MPLTGYDLDAASVQLDDPALEPIVAACGESDSAALVGAPVHADGARFIAMLLIDDTGVQVA